MSSSVQAKKWRKQNPNYSKNWYQANKERIREQARKKYHESVVAKRLENASAQLDEEEWKQIPDFENYKVNKHGEVKNKFGKTLLPGKIPSTGYLHVSLSNKEVKGKHFYVHQLVWKAFNGEIPDGLIVCHVDTNPQNNNLENLCLMTHKENLNKPETIENFKRSQRLYPRKNSGKKKTVVYQFDMDGNLVKRWDSVKATEEEGFSPSCVSLCCSGKYRQHKNFMWSKNKEL